jgi:hypothetical protein
VSSLSTPSPLQREIGEGEDSNQIFYRLDPLLLIFKEKINKKIIKRRSVKSKKKIDTNE